MKMVDYGTMLLIGISLGIVFFGLRYYYESKIRHILEVKGKSDEVVGEIIGKYIELIAMNFALNAKVGQYEKKYGKIEEEKDTYETKARMVLDKINTLDKMANDSPKG